MMGLRVIDLIDRLVSDGWSGREHSLAVVSVGFWWVADRGLVYLEKRSRIQ